MLLYEIVGGEKIRHSGEYATPANIRRDRTKSNDLQALGQGRQGIVALRTKKINTVTKIFGFNDENSGYVRFIQAIGSQQDNPYLPRVSNLRLYNKPFVSSHRFDTYRKTGMVDIEKLIPANHPKVREVVKSKLRQLGVKSLASLDWDSFLHVYDKAKSRGDIQPDEQLERAIELLTSFMKMSDVDLHSKNIMVRLTAAGPQLVLVDPVWD